MIHPLVSVYLPTRNRARLLEQAIRSVLNQRFKNFELIVVNDASSDETQTVCELFSKGDARIRVLRNNSSLGAAVSRNRAIAVARGRYITGLDDDDLMSDRRLESMLFAFDESFAFVSTSYWYERYMFGKRRRRLEFGSQGLISLDDLLFRNVVGNQVLTLTERVRSIGGFDETFVASQDYDLWTRLCENFGYGLRIASPSYIFRAGMTDSGITVSTAFAEGARQYTAKHRHKMSSAQLKSQALLHAITAKKPIRLRDLRRYWARKSQGLLYRYLVTTSRPMRWVRDRFLVQPATSPRSPR